MVIKDRATTIKKGGFIWLPHEYTAVYKLLVTRSDSSEDDLTDLINYVEIEDGVTDSIGRFEFQLWDPNETYLNAWTGTEKVTFYMDYGATAATLVFRGQIEKVVYQGNKVKCTGRGEALRIMSLTVTQEYAEIECSEILKDLFDKYATDFTYTNVKSSAESLTVSWYQKPFFECIGELTKASGFDFYIDANLDVHFIEAGSVSNDNEAIVHGQNLLNVGEFGQDISLIRNRIIIYGAEQEGVPILYTAEDATSQATYGVKEEIINDTNVTFYIQAKEMGDYLLSNFKDPPDIGDVKGNLLATIQPGEQIRLSSPADNITPGLYDIISYKHRVDNNSGEMTTTVKVSKEPRDITHVLKSMIENTTRLKEAYSNPEEMRHSYTFLYDTDTGTHSNTKIANGFLLLSSGDSGNWVSPTRTLSANATEAYLMMNGENLEGITVSVSADNGINYDTITRKEKIILTSPGKYLRIKVTFSSATSSCDSLSILYK